MVNDNDTATPRASRTSRTRRIGIDCEPLTPRPDTYIKHVLEGTGLTATEPVAKCFGAWIWEFSATDEEWNRILPIVRSRITALYETGRIRGGLTG